MCEGGAGGGGHTGAGPIILGRGHVHRDRPMRKRIMRVFSAGDVPHVAGQEAFMRCGQQASKHNCCSLQRIHDELNTP